MIKKLFSHTALYGLAPQLPKIASIFVLPIITKYLTEIDYGVAGIVGAYTGALSVLQSLGVNIILANSFHKHPTTYKWLWRQLHGFISLWSLGYGVLLSLVLFFGIPAAAYDDLWLIILLNVIPPVFFSTTQMMVFRYFQMSGKPGPIATRSIMVGVISVGLNLYFIAELKLGYLGWFLSSFVANFISFLIFSYLLYFRIKLTPIFNFKWRIVRSSLKVSLPTVPHYYSSYLLNSSDRLVLDWLKIGTDKIGLYNFASTFGNYFSTLGNAVGLAVGPMYIKFYKQGEIDPEVYTKTRTLTFFVQSGFLFLTFLVCLWMKEIFYVLVSNKELQKVYPLAIIIVMGYNYRPMYLGATSFLFYYEKTKKLWKVSFMAGVSNVVLNLLLIPLFGYQIAAVTTFVSLMYMGYSAYFMSDYKEIKKLEYYPIRWLTVTCIVAVASFLLKDAQIIMKAGISVITILLCTLYIFKSKFIKLLNE